MNILLMLFIYWILPGVSIGVLLGAIAWKLTRMSYDEELARLKARIAKIEEQNTAIFNPAAETSISKPEDSDSCLECGEPLPASATTCQKCGWTYEAGE